MKLAAAAKHLKKSDPEFGVLIDSIGPCTLSPLTDRSPFEALVRAIAHQQLHGKAAETILARFIALIPRLKKESFPNPNQVQALSHTELRKVGFSENKVSAIFDITEKVLNKEVPTTKQMEKMAEEEIIAKLVPLRGVGRWTAEMYLIFTLGRLDVLPVDDFGIKEGFRVAFKKKKQPTKEEMQLRAKRWAPYRTVASWYLWRVADNAKIKKDK